MARDTPSRLKLMRSRLGLTQAGAAVRLGTTLRTYQGWEAGKRSPATPEIIDLACLALERQR
jgi:DNA-binding transcriptional regulator YiaG